MTVTPNPDKHVAQLIDANLDRAREGLRVIEDWCRYGLQRKDLIVTIKNFRQQLGQCHKEIYKQARSASTDQGSGLTHLAQQKRNDPLEIVFANCARVQEALRVIEEFSRSTDEKLSNVASQIRYEVYELESNILKATRGNVLRKKLQSCKLCLVTKPHPELFNIVSNALKAGITMVQYRCKKEIDSNKVSQAQKLAALCKEHRSLFIINDRVDLALALDADGVHLGQEDIPVDIARNLLGSEKLIGLSTHSLEEAKSAQDKGCDYIGFGPVFKTNSKPGLNPLGFSSFKELSRSISLPWFAIGGINQKNVSQVFDEGATRVAVINSIMNEKDTYIATQTLLRN